MMLARNLLYTGVTRGKRLVVLVGQRKALAIAVRNHGSRRRWTKLREHLTGTQSNQPMTEVRQDPATTAADLGDGIACDHGGHIESSGRRSKHE
jgi:hypothetical protein